MQEVQIAERQPKTDDVWVKSVCYMCFNCCGIRAHRVNGIVVKIEGDPDCPHNFGKLCAKGLAGAYSLYNPRRITTPLRRTNPQKGIGIDPGWVEMSWEEALDTVAERLRKVRSDDPRKLLAMTFDTSLYPSGLLASFMSAFGSPHIISGGAGFFCGNALHPVAHMTQSAFFVDPDLPRCNYLILFGSQTGFMANSNATLMVKRMAAARSRGLKVVVVDPMCNSAAAKADEWLPIRPGTDAALALGMLDVILNELGIFDAPFLRRYTNGPYLVGPDGRYVRDRGSGRPLVWDERSGQVHSYDEGDPADFALEGRRLVEDVECWPAFHLLREHVRGYPPERVAEITSIPATTIRRIAREYAEAASIGSTVTIDGHELPFRPVAAQFSKGSAAHKHAMHVGIAIQLLNIVVGAIDVPGGLLGCSSVGPGSERYFGRSWAPQEGPDGMIVAGRSMIPLQSFPARLVKRPETMNLIELFPVAPYAPTMLFANLLEPERFGVSYVPEVLLHSRSNAMMSTGDPEQVAEVLGRIPFQVSFAREIDETVEFADIVLPDTHYLERLDGIANDASEWMEPGDSEWYFMLRQPVVDPPPGVRHWNEVLFELADRIGIRPDVHVLLNVALGLKPPFQLDPDARYSWEEFTDRWLKSTFGAEHGLDWFKEHREIKWPRRIEEAFPRPFFTARLPLYFEHFGPAGAEVARVTRSMGIDEWDTSDYQPLPDWRPCPAHRVEDPQFDLFAINYKLPTHTFSNTMENPILADLAQLHPLALTIALHESVARRKGIRDGQEVWLESAEGRRVKGPVRLTRAIHPEAVGIAGTFGHWAQRMPVARRGRGVHFNALLPITLDRIDAVSACLDACVKVRIYPA